MPKKHVRALGSKCYQDHFKEILCKAVNAVKTGKISASQPDKTFSIPRRTIANKVKEKHTAKVGRPPALSDKAELNFKEHVLAMSEFGFPFDTCDLSMTVKLLYQKVQL